MVIELMGIDVASYAHKDKRPIEVAFGLDDTPCIGCGGCIDVCPVDALSFSPIGRSGLSIVGKSDRQSSVATSLPIVENTDGDQDQRPERNKLAGV